MPDSLCETLPDVGVKRKGDSVNLTVAAGSLEFEEEGTSSLKDLNVPGSLSTQHGLR